MSYCRTILGTIVGSAEGGVEGALMRNPFLLAIISVLTAIGISTAAQCPSAGQSKALSFAVASVTRLAPNSRAGYQTTSNPKRLSIPGLSLRQLIMAAYGLRLDQVTGGPHWMDGPRFAVEATTRRPATRGEEMLMLRRALVQRFRG